MTDREVEARLKCAMDHAAPDDIDDVFARCAVGKGLVIDVKDVPARRPRRWGNFIAACLALALVGAGGGLVFHQQVHTVASVISLDVNPSIEMKANKNETVLSCSARNAAAEAVLVDMNGGKDLVGRKLQEAVNIVVDAFMQNGYLDNTSSTILISVEDDNTVRGDRIQEELSAAVGGTLQDAESHATVLTQTMTVDAGLDAQAKQNNISSGKAYLVDQVAAMNDMLTFEDLAPLSVEELQDMRQSGAAALPIGKDAALTAVLACAGLTAEDCASASVDPELDGSTYEVKLLVGGEDYHFSVDAYTGEILGNPPVVAVQSTVAAGTQPLEVFAAGSPAPQMSPAPSGTDVPSGEPAENGGAATASSDAVPTMTPTSGDVGESAALNAALSHAGLTEADISGLLVQRVERNGRAGYRVRFTSAGCEYSYVIDGATGAVLERASESINGNNASHSDDSATLSTPDPLATPLPTVPADDPASSVPAATPEVSAESGMPGIPGTPAAPDGTVEPVPTPTPKPGGEGNGGHAWEVPPNFTPADPGATTQPQISGEIFPPMSAAPPESDSYESESSAELLTPEVSVEPDETAASEDNSSVPDVSVSPVPEVSLVVEPDCEQTT